MPSRDFRAASLPGWAALFVGLSFAPSALTGCDGEENASDGDSPNHIIKAPQSQGKYRYGITDTLTVEFDEDIDTAALDLDYTDTAGIGWRLVGRRKAQIYGTRSTFGVGHFPINSPFTVTLTGLRDLAGNGHPSIDIGFLPYRWADRDFLDTTYDWFDSLYADSGWIDGSRLSDTLIVEGAGVRFAASFAAASRSLIRDRMP